jgi:hypothetical protein
MSSAASPVQRLVALAGLFRRPPLPAFKRRARGVVDRSNPRVRVIVVRINDAMFERISRGAVASGVNMTEAIRQLLERGLDARSPNGKE